LCVDFVDKIFFFVGVVTLKERKEKKGKRDRKEKETRK
tara:strand:+ start:248 stop:361 length:114 start_codon:yes stop_codon:yes gene_type:complete